MTLTEEKVKKIVQQVLKGEDYRFVILEALNETFLNHAMDFFKKVVDAKLSKKPVDADWYKEAFIDDPSLTVDDVMNHAGLNRKTVTNMFKTAKKEIALDAAQTSYDQLLKSIEGLVDPSMDGDGIDVQLTITLNKVSVNLNVNESLIVINAIAVKRASLRGGYWSAAGKRVERPLMETLCRMYKVPTEHYDRKSATGEEGDSNAREGDFYLFNDGIQYKCEVKLMGKGNPESADSAYARRANVFVADTLSDQQKHNLDEDKIKWVELSEDGNKGFRRFGRILTELGIPHNDPDGNVDVVEEVDQAFRTYSPGSGEGDISQSF